MRFQKRIKIAPGVIVNLSKSGVSTSFGPTGAKFTIGNGRHHTTIGIPGTGLSHTTRSAGPIRGIFNSIGLGIVILIAIGIMVADGLSIGAAIGVAVIAILAHSLWVGHESRKAAQQATAEADADPNHPPT
jgi:hypothetical protein